MTYSKKIQDQLDKNKLKTGDQVEIDSSGKKYIGLLIPRPDIGNTNCLVLKLENGYNIGIDCSKDFSLKKIEHKHKDLIDEEKFELGKIKESLVKVSFNPKKSPISLIATGGTIASRVDYKTGGVYMQMDPKEFLHNVPELADIVNIKNILKPFTVASEDMDHTHWQEIAKLAAKELNSGAQGIIITHGTDTLHYTSAVLSFFLKNLSKPVVLVGSQKSTDRGSSDGFINLICASHIAVSDIAEVGICMHGSVNDDYCLFTRGTKIRKMDTVRRDAFRPINDLPIALVWPDGKIEKRQDHKKRFDTKVEVDDKFEEKVALIKTYPGSDPSVIDWYMNKGYKGFVIEGTGLGHIPTQARRSWISTIKKYSKDTPFVICSQTIYGRVNPNVYTNLRILFHDSGAIPGEDMTSETKRIV